MEGDKPEIQRAKTKWNDDRTAYVCADRVQVCVRAQFAAIPMKKLESFFSMIQGRRLDDRASPKKGLINGIDCVCHHD